MDDRNVGDRYSACPARTLARKTQAAMFALTHSRFGPRYIVYVKLAKNKL